MRKRTTASYSTTRTHCEPSISKPRHVHSTKQIPVFVLGSTFFVWFVAARKKHWLVSLGSILFIITVVFHPLTAALFSVRDVEFPSKISANNTVVVGLNNDTNFQDLTCASPYWQSYYYRHFLMFCS